MFGFIKEKFKSIKETVQFFKELDEAECCGVGICQLSAEELDKIGEEVFIKYEEDLKKTASELECSIEEIQESLKVKPTVTATASEILVESMKEYKNTELDSNILNILNNIHSGYVVEPVTLNIRQSK